jgi:hypothetical protein
VLTAVVTNLGPNPAVGVVASITVPVGLVVSAADVPAGKQYHLQESVQPLRSCPKSSLNEAWQRPVSFFRHALPAELHTMRHRLAMRQHLRLLPSASAGHAMKH